MMKYEILTGESKNVFKYVFTLDDGAVIESVLYRYPDFKTRTVLCISTQCGCRCGCTFCLPPGEQIQTANGLKNIEDIEVGDLVVSYNTQDKQRKLDEVTRLTSNDYDGELIEIELEDGNILRLTPNHEVLIDDGSWIPAGKLNKNHTIVSL